MESTEHKLLLRDEIVTTEIQHDLDSKGIAKTAREEKTRARDEKQKTNSLHDAKMAALYREVVLKEKPQTSEGGFIPLTALGSAPAAPKPPVAEEVLGD